MTAKRKQPVYAWALWDRFATAALGGITTDTTLSPEDIANRVADIATAMLAKRRALIDLQYALKERNGTRCPTTK